jgi:hypothetical protein
MLRDCHISPQVKFGGGSVMVWGSITYSGVEALIFIESRMNSEMFINILRSGLALTLEMHALNFDDVILQQDNDPKHTSIQTRRYLEASNIRVLPWPSCSSD